MYNFTISFKLLSKKLQYWGINRWKSQLSSFKCSCQVKKSQSLLLFLQNFLYSCYLFSYKAVLKFTVRTIIGLQIYFHWRFWVGIGITAVFSRCTDSLIASSSCSSASHVTAKVLTFIYVSFPSASNNIVSRYICQILDLRIVQKIICVKYMWFFTHHHLLFL